MEKLDEYFAPKHHESMERNVFWTLKPDPNENLEKFMLRAREQAYKCNFGATVQESRDICVIDKIILFSPPDLREKLLQRDSLKLDDVFKIVASHQSVKYQASQMTAGPSSGPSSMSIPSTSSDVNRLQTDTNVRRGHVECGRCGRKGHFANDPKCPARDKECHLCKRVGHYAKKCKTSSMKGTGSRPVAGNLQRPSQRSSNRVRKISDEQVENEQVDEKPKSFIFAIGDGDEFIWIKIGGVMTQILIDSGSNKNIIDGETWNRLKAQGVEIRNATTKVDHQFCGYGIEAKPMKVLGMFDSTVELQDESQLVNQEARFYVVQDGNQPLLGKETAKDLNVLRLGLPKQQVDVNKVCKLE